MEKEIITLSSSTANINDSIVISSTGGVDINYTTLTWKKQGTITEYEIARGAFKFDSDIFEPLFTNATEVADGITIIFTLTSHGYNEQGQEIVDYSTASCLVKMIEQFIPHIYTGLVTSQPLYNGHIRAGSTATSTIELIIDNPGTFEVTPSITNVVSDAPVTYTLNDDNVVFTLPEINQEKYTITFRLNIVDARGMSSYTDVEAWVIGDIYCYNAPGLTLTEMYRCDEEGLKTPNGTYGRFIGNVVDTDSSLWEFVIDINDKTYTILPDEDGNYDITVGEGKLDVSENYGFEISYTNTYMHTNDYSPISIVQRLEAQKVPISLMDTGVIKGISVGEMGQDYDETTSDTVFNFGNESEVRARTGNEVVVESAYNVVNAHKYITETVLNNLKFVAISEYEYDRLRNKDSETIYFVY